MKIFRPIWAEIDCDKVEHNLRQVRAAVGPDVKIMGVVKADAYGHGAKAVSKSLLHAGADCLAVASLEEAVELRDAGVDTEILILGFTQTGWVSDVVAGGFIQTVYHLGLARALSAEAVRQNKTARVHLKIDTGMSRIGVNPESALHLIREISSLEAVELEGLYTHFSCADEPDDEITEQQLDRFKILEGVLEENNIKIPVLHAANSAALLKYPATRLDMVRPGIVLYGLAPSTAMKTPEFQFKPVMTIKSTIVELKTVPPGTRVSYGGTFVTERPTRLATLPAGYADGFSRKLSNRGRVLVNGREAPIVGNVCMDFMMVDVTDVPGVKVDDDAVLVGSHGEREISMDEIAEITGTINYEVASLIGKRVHRVFVNFLAGNPNEL